MYNSLMHLSESVSRIPGIGRAYTKLLEKIDIKTVEDLLYYVPFRYDDNTNVCRISDLTANTQATVTVKVSDINNIFTRGGKRLTKARVEDETGQMDVIWFNQTYLKKSLKPGTVISLNGQLDQKSTRPQFVSPNWEILYNGESTHTRGIIPVYNTTEGISARWLRAKIKLALKYADIKELFDNEIKRGYGLLNRAEAMRNIHFPESFNKIEPARHTLAFEELLLIHLTGMSLKSKWHEHVNGYVIEVDTNLITAFIKSLPYKLTNAQTRVLGEIVQDLKAEIPMNRLIQGDVGSGKTVVAAAAMLCAINAGHNCIILAPTQILANQHLETLQKFLKPYNINFVLATGKTSSEKISDAKTIIIGTHAILHRLKNFTNIGLIVIDEQHKFGVLQRSIVTDYYTSQFAPNLLTMTATPIPRSIALVLYGDLDLSVIDEMPPGRIPVKTWLVEENRRTSAYKWIKGQVEKLKTQAIIVCPFIDQSQYEDLKNVKAAKDEYEKVKKHFSKQKLGLLHGRLSSIEKEEVIDKFVKQKIDILVTTPVIEVGVDIPNANIIVIETSERFGLASLHQLRGRVGRGKDQGYCILFTSSNDANLSRLKYLEKIHNGSRLAEIDLKIRGPGNIYGTQQHGFMSLRVADITDTNLIKLTKGCAVSIFGNFEKHHAIKEKLDKIMIINND